MNAIEIKGLKKVFKSRIHKNWIKNIFKPEYNSVEVVKNISFTVQKGESVAFLGPNGAGKTTTTKMMTGLIYPTSGEVSVLGFTPNERKKDFLMRIGLVMGNKSGLNWDLTAMQTFQLYREIYKINSDKFKSRVEELTKLLDVEKHLDKPVRKLSLGERMKLELIGAILHDPEILFLDEPTIGLDIIAKQNIRQFLRKIQKESGITLILTSHDMDDIEEVCDRVLVINQGNLVYDDSINLLKSNYDKDRYVKFIFDKEIALDEFTQYGDIYESNKYEVVYKVIPSEMPKMILAITQRYNVIDIDIHSTPLEEMIKEIFEGNS